MGIKSIAVFSDADRLAPYVKEADVASHIGESSPAASYLDQDKIITTAQRLGADAIHPGYGFLAENADFARKCKEAGIIFIGPNPEAIEAMGSKSNAKSLMKQHGVPVVPGYQGTDQSVETLTFAAVGIGFPVLLKATAGGGGKGMRIVREQSELKAAIEAAKREALSAFGDDELIIEKYIASGRHIEFQIFGDQQGNVIHLLERECSIQRRYQKVIEESPSPVMSPSLRSSMGKAAVQAAKALNYDNAGTVEFIFDDVSQEFYFLEVNTRLQVEHPVTEEITGLDLVQMQIESAQGLPLAISQEEVQGRGYAIECRLYAEDASNEFRPVTGSILRFDYPQVKGLRMESAVETGSEVSIYYDPMIAKVIVWDRSRAMAHRKMQYVLRNLVCLGMTTNQAFLSHLLQHPDFLKGTYDTHFIQNKLSLSDIGQATESAKAYAAIAACLYAWKGREQGRGLLKGLPSGWRNNFNDYQQANYLIGEERLRVQYRYMKGGFQCLIGESQYEVSICDITPTSIRLEINGLQSSFELAVDDRTYFLQHETHGVLCIEEEERFPLPESEAAAGGYESPMPSQIVRVLVEPGQSVKSGEGLVVLSSMKMENTIVAMEDGVVEEIYVTTGQNVEANYLLLTLTPTEESNG